MTRERPITLHQHEVQAVLAGRQTQLRRPVKFPKGVRDGQVKAYLGFTAGMHVWMGVDKWGGQLACPFGEVGDRLYVREAFCPDPPHDGTWCFYEYTDGVLHNDSAIPKRFQSPAHVLYRATDTDFDLRWHPASRLPRWASRATLEIVNIWVERLNAISEEDAIAEGVTVANGLTAGYLSRAEAESLKGKYIHQRGFANLWNMVNSKKHPWSSNPFVWCVEFRKVEADAL